MKQRAGKVKWVSDKEEFIRNNNTFIFTGFSGLTVKNMTELRRLLRRINASAEVVKNRIFKRLMEKEWEKIALFFEGPTAVIFSGDNSTGEVCKVLASFGKENESFKIKGGFLRPARILTDKDIAEIAKIPDRNTLLVNFIWAIQGPLYGFHSVCKNLISGIVFVLSDYARKKKNNMVVKSNPPLPLEGITAENCPPVADDSEHNKGKRPLIESSDRELQARE
ncbi:MAG: 50S ribosomal protein L10 [bacterium]